MDLNTIAVALVVIGAINWGLIGMFGINAVVSLVKLVSRNRLYTSIIYTAVGAAGVYVGYSILTADEE